MNATPRSQQQAEREELGRLLPAAAHPDLSPGRHRLLKEHLMNAVTEQSHCTAHRHGLTMRVALPLGLAAAAVGALTVMPDRTAPQPRAASAPSAAASTDFSGGIRTVSYALTPEKDGIVKLTILKADGTPDTAGIRADLERMGVRARIYEGDPACTTPVHLKPSFQSNGPPDDVSMEDGKPVARIDTTKIPADATYLIDFPLARTEPAQGRKILITALTKELPDCVPAAPAGTRLPDHGPLDAPWFLH